jgi:hypothetical protein
VIILCTSVLGIYSSRDALISDFCRLCLKPFPADGTVSTSNPGLPLCGLSFTVPVSLNCFTHFEIKFYVSCCLPLVCNESSDIYGYFNFASQTTQSSLVEKPFNLGGII